MNRISPDILDPRTDSELRGLDPATPLTAEDRIRSEARMAQILATDPAAPSTVPAPARAVPLRRRAAVRWASAAAALAAVTTAGLAISTVGAPAAYATWTATPAQVAAADNAGGRPRKGMTRAATGARRPRPKSKRPSLRRQGAVIGGPSRCEF